MEYACVFAAAEDACCCSRAATATATAAARSSARMTDGGLSLLKYDISTCLVDNTCTLLWLLLHLP